MSLPGISTDDIKAVVQDLENLRKDYQQRASELPKQHIGVYIKEIISKAHPESAWAWARHYDRALEIRLQIRSIMDFVLDHYQDMARLNEPDEDQRTPLHVAMNEEAVDCLEILLARGADPDNRSGSQTPFQRLHSTNMWDRGTTQFYVRAYCGLFYQHNLVNLWQQLPSAAGKSEYVSFTCRGVNLRGSTFDAQFGHQEVGLGGIPLDGPWVNDFETDEYSTWIHVTFTNAGQCLFFMYAKNLSQILRINRLQNLCRTIEGIVNKNRSRKEQMPVLESFCSVIRPPLVKPGNVLLTYRDSIYSSLSIDGKTVGSAMVFPYLVLERISALLESRAMYNVSSDDTDPSPMSRYGSGDAMFLGPCLDRTLDEAYFPSMDDSFFERRNRDQVVSREWTRERIRKYKPAHPDSAPLLLVSQSWLWNFNDSVLLSAYSIKRTSSRYPRFTMKDGRMVPRLFGIGPAPPIELQMGLIIAGQVSEFGEEHEREDEGSKFKSTLHMFEMAVISALSDVQRYLDAKPGFYNIKQQKKKEQGFIHDMSDIHSELDMITSVLEQQKKIMNKFLRETKTQQEGASDQEREGWALVKQARAMLNDYTDRVEKIHRDADRVDKTIESYLNLKRTYASIEDTRNSLMVGFAATAFAFVTVIFTPLSFMTSLFALPVDRFARQQYKEADSEDGVFKSSYIAGYTALAGIVTWLLTIALLVGLYYYWKISSRPENKEKQPGANATKRTKSRTNIANGEQIEDMQDGNNKNEETSGAGSKTAATSGGLRGARLWHRKPTKEEHSNA